MDIILKRTNSQRVEIRKTYKTMFGEVSEFSVEIKLNLNIDPGYNCTSAALGTRLLSVESKFG